jgi:hypothetical protein
MPGNLHVRFGGAVWGNDQGKPWHRAPGRPLPSPRMAARTARARRAQMADARRTDVRHNTHRLPGLTRILTRILT